MKNIFTIIFLLTGIWSVTAQDLIVLRNGEMIESKVVEISQTEIRYRRYTNLDGPMIVIPAANVLSIRYENGTYEIINTSIMPEQGNTQTTTPDITNVVAEKLTRIGLNVNPAGLIPIYGPMPSVCIELTRGKFNSELNLLFPLWGGFGGFFTFNYFHPTQIGGAYIGGGIGGLLLLDYYYEYLGIIFGLNAGYKFILSSGIYFRTGAFVGGMFDFSYGQLMFYLKPDLSIGYSF
ncbi:MAG: hypothetical protein FWD13_01010 [Treponema sp.]|nr:hypothetical protein [Treponema sp.]